MTKPVFIALLVFAFLMVLTQYLAYERYLLVKDTELNELNNEANGKKERLQTALSYSQSTAQTLGFIVERYGIPIDFDTVAKELLSANKFIDAVQLVQGGVITHVYPLKGNEVVIGYNILKDSLRNKGAFTAIETKQFFWAGPINLKQGGVGIVGRQPLFKNDKFYGFSAVIIKLPTLLHTIGIDSHFNNGFTYQLSRINTDNHTEEFFLPNHQSYNHALVVPVEIPNGEWRLYVTRKNQSTLFFALTFSVLGFILSLTGAFFAWFMARQPQQLNKLVEEKTIALVSAENNLRNTLERVSDAFVAIDKNFCYTYMNKKAGEIFHRDPASIIGKNMWEEFPAWIGKPFYYTFQEAMKNQKYVLLEEYYEKQNLWFESHIYPSPKGLSVFLNDITERKKAEHEILREKNLSESVINSLPGVFYLADLDGNMLRWNKNIETVSGYLPDEIKNMRARDFVAIDDQEELRMKKEMAIKDGVSDAEVNFLTKQGKELPYYITAVLSEYNNQPCLLGVGIDITERKKAEQALQESEEKYRYLFDNNPALIFIWDLETLGILEINQNAEHEYGYTREEALQMTVLDLRPVDDHPKIRDFAVRMFSSTEDKSRGTWRHLKKNGEMMYMDIRSHRIEYNNRKAILSLAENVTEKILIEQQLNKSYEDIRLLNNHLQTIREEERTAISRELHDELGQQLTALKMDIVWLSKKIKDSDIALQEKIAESAALVDETVKTTEQ